MQVEEQEFEDAMQNTFPDISWQSNVPHLQSIFAALVVKPLTTSHTVAGRVVQVLEEATQYRPVVGVHVVVPHEHPPKSSLHQGFGGPVSVSSSQVVLVNVLSWPSRA